MAHVACTQGSSLPGLARFGHIQVLLHRSKTHSNADAARSSGTGPAGLLGLDQTAQASRPSAFATRGFACMRGTTPASRMQPSQQCADLLVVVAHLLIARCNSVDDLFCNLPAPNRVRSWAKAGLLHRAKVGFAPGQRPMADDIVCGFA
jgi:hypothetical protein